MVNGTVPVPFCKSEVKVFDVASHAREQKVFVLVDQLDSFLPFLRIMLTDAMDDDDQVPVSSTTAEMPASTLIRHSSLYISTSLALILSLLQRLALPPLTTTLLPSKDDTLRAIFSGGRKGGKKILQC